MKKLALSLICANAFASSFVGLGFYGSNIDNIELKDKRIYTYEIYANKFYSEGENNFVYDARMSYARYSGDYKEVESDTKLELNGNAKIKLLKLQALGGYGVLVGNDISVSFLGGLGYERINAEVNAGGSKQIDEGLYTAKFEDSGKEKSMFLKVGIAARKQFDNNFTVGAGAYLKYFTKKIEDVRRFSPEADLSLGYTFTNNIYAGVKVGYENDLIGHGGKLGFELGYKF